MKILILKTKRDCSLWERERGKASYYIDKYPYVEDIVKQLKFPIYGIGLYYGNCSDRNPSIIRIDRYEIQRVQKEGKIKKRITFFFSFFGKRLPITSAEIINKFPKEYVAKLSVEEIESRLSNHPEFKKIHNILELIFREHIEKNFAKYDQRFIPPFINELLNTTDWQIFYEAI